MSITRQLLVPILLATVYFLNAVPLTNGACCETDKNTPFGCCSYKKCNVFCCNCDAKCRPKSECNSGNKPIASDSGNATQSISDYAATLNSFKRLDLNGDRVIDGNELVAYYLGALSATKAVNDISSKGDADLETYALQFKSLDQNQDGVIQPNELDRDLA